MSSLVECRGPLQPWRGSVGHVCVRKQNKKFLWRAQLHVEGLTTRLERAKQALSHVKNSVSRQNKENHMPSSTGTSDSADPNVSLVHVPADDGHRERVAGWDGCQVCVFLFSWRPHSLWVWFWGYCEYDPRISDSITRSFFQMTAPMTVECT